MPETLRILSTPSKKEIWPMLPAGTVRVMVLVEGFSSSTKKIICGQFCGDTFFILYRKIGNIVPEPFNGDGFAGAVFYRIAQYQFSVPDPVMKNDGDLSSGGNCLYRSRKAKTGNHQQQRKYGGDRSHSVIVLVYFFA
jgi:hypothetical protein